MIDDSTYTPLTYERIMGFLWDLAKEEDNLQRHGIDVSATAKAFADPDAIAKYVASHSSEA